MLQKKKKNVNLYGFTAELTMLMRVRTYFYTRENYLTFAERNIFHIIGYSGTSKIRKFMFYEFKQKSKLYNHAKHHPLFSRVLLVKGSKMFNYNFELLISSKLL